MHTALVHTYAVMVCDEYGVHYNEVVFLGLK